MARAGTVLGVLALVTPFAVGGVGAVQGVARPAAREVTTFTDPDITESSGLVRLPGPDGLLVTTNDSGDSGRVFVVDPRTGDTVGTTTYDLEPRDVEALAPGGPDHPREVWVGDVGDNLAVRDDVAVWRVPVGRGDRTASPTRYPLTLPGGPADVESLATDPATGRLVLVTKGFFGGRVLLAPARLRADRPNRVREIGTALPIATDAAFTDDGRFLVVRGYGRAVVYSWPDLEGVGGLRLPAQDQGEAVATTPGGTLLLSSEGVRAPVLEVVLPARLRTAMQPPAAPDPSAAPGDAAPAGPGRGSDAGRGTGLVAGGAALLVAGAATIALVRRRRGR
ncbi:hypothetical protein [Nocardioides sp.]